MNLKVASLNTESGCRPGFHEYLKQFITYTEPDVIALQEVHSAANLSVPETFMPSNRGKRIYPQRLRLYQELCHRYGETFELLFTPNLHGLHDCEQGKYDVAFGQVTMVRRQTWKVVNSASGLVFLDEYTFNTEHGVVIGGMPSSKAAITVVIKCTMSGKTVTIANTHGFWLSRGKIDVPERFIQNLGIAKQIGDVLSESDTPLVLCVGDLNYRSDMTALEHLRSHPVFGDYGRILNHDFDISRTRTDHYLNWEREPEADFMIASSELADTAVYMKVHLDAASDHALLEAKFKIT